MDFVSPIITPIMQSLMEPLKKYLGFLVSSTKYVKEMDAKIKQLKDTAQEVQATWDTAVGNTEVVPECVEPWLEDVKKLSERSDNLIKATGCFNLTKRYKVGKQSCDILEEIKFLESRESKIVFPHAQKPLAEVGSTSTMPSTSALVPMGTQIDFESRDSIFSDALQALKSNNESQKMIALCGMGGVGKTTIMEQLKKALEDSNTFNLVVKVVIGESNDVISLQQAIAQYIGCDLTEQTKDARADRLRKIFEAKSQQGQKILVIMDDLWSEVDMNDVGLSPLPHGLKMLFTSRFENVCAEMGVHLILRMQVLNKIEAKTLFSKTVRPSPWDGDDAELQRIGEEIVIKCGGLPIAIVTIAKILSGNIKEAWKTALWRLKKDDLKDLERITRRIFEMSYENLKEDGDKAIFLLCGLFPDDFDISTEDLLRYGWGLNFYKDAKTLVIARQLMKVYVNNLIRANLLTESDVIGCVKMHDLVRAFVLNNLSEVKQASIVSHENKIDANKSYERILFKCKDMCEIPRVFNYSNLSLFILMDGDKLKFSKDIFKRMEKLKVMSYEKLGIPLLPVMFEHSTKLRTIRLRSCLLINNDISFLGSLCNLEILSLVDCNIRRLPSTIGNLKKLKLLDLNGCIDLHIDDGVIQNLESLEELYLRASGNCVVRFTHANCDELKEISQRLFVLELEFIARTPQKHSVSRQDKPQLRNMSFKNLERFKISIGCELENKYSDSFKNELHLVVTSNELHECNISDLFERTEELKLEVNDMYNLEDISTHHTFCQLRVFHVFRCANLTCLFTPDMASGLKKLEELTVSECPALKEMVSKNSGVGVIAFQKLNFMSLEDLPEMVTLCEDVIELPELMELRLCGLTNFTSIYHDNNSDMSAIQPLLNTKVTIPKLEILDISMMENLKQIWPCEKNGVSTLRQIRVSNCDSLINLFPSNPLPLLNHLEELVVENCNSIEVLFNKKVVIPKLENLKHIWSCETTVENIVSMLRKIKVRECNNLINLFPSNPLPLLNHLEELEVGKCGAIEVLFNLEFESVCGTWECDSSKLRSISVNDLGKLKELWRMKGVNKCDIHIKCFKGVERITIERCPHFTNIFTPTTINFDLGGLTSYVTKNKTGEEIDAILKGEISEMDEYTPNVRYPSNLLQLPFQNLKNITLENCPRLKYLFSPLMAKYLSNLKNVKIYHCYGIEEVMSSRDDENEENTTSASSHQNNTFFPHLDTLRLSYMSCLKSIDGGDQTRSRSGKISSNLTNTLHGQSQSAQVSGACWSLCQYPRKIEIHNCDALSSLVPWYSVRQMKSLQELGIFSCKTMKEVFESESSTSYNVDEGSTPGTTLVVPQLTNLKSVYISGCDTLSHVFTFSTLESLSQLKDLRVQCCQAIQVIVKEENETSSKDIVVFHRLEKLVLDKLPNLKGFFLGLNDFRWPLLNDVMIDECPRLMVFTSGQSNTPKLKYIRTNFGKYCGLNFHGTVNVNQTTFPVSSSSDLTVSKGMPWSSFHNLIEIQIDGLFFGTTVARTNYIIPSNVLLQLEKLEKIEIGDYYGVKEVVFEALEGSGFNESQPTTIFKIPNLTEVNLIYVLNLKYLWKSNRSMVLEFPNLTTLSINECYKLEHVFTCSMVGSLVQLQDLQIKYCRNIEVIVKEEEEECCDVKVNALPRLKFLKLENLPTLEGFCLGKDAFSLPVLDTLEIKGCEAIEVFTKGDLSAPNLEFIDSNLGMFTINEDLNSFIETNQEKFVARG